MIEQLIALQKEVYQGNKDRGFWEEGLVRNREEAIMLIITELSEAVESHRKGRLFNVPDAVMITLTTPTDDDSSLKHWKTTFEQTVKDTVEDELADTVIRILDCTCGFNWPLQYNPDLGAGLVSLSDKGNFAEKCFYIVQAITNWRHHSDAWSVILFKLVKLAKANNIDLLWHVQLKLKYNGTRPYKHGKQY